ncbi:MAG: alpha/beta hydrolase [Rhodomicrobium sp.]
MASAASEFALDPEPGEGVEDRFAILPGGRKLSFSEFGDPDGLPVFGFHGTPGSRLMFRLVHKPAQRTGLRFIAPDRPGFGNSTYQLGRTLAAWAKDTEWLANHLGLRRFAVAGISGGGPYAVACAALLPNRVSACALMGPLGPLRQPEGPKAIGAMHYAMFRIMPEHRLLANGAFYLSRYLFLNAPDTVYGMIVRRASAADRHILSRPDVRENLIDGVGEGLRPGIRGSVQEMRIFSKPWNLPFDAIKAPVLMWQGMQDRNVPLSAALRLARLIPTCELSRIDNAGHYWIFEHIDDVLKAIKQKIAGQPAETRRE